MFLYLVSIDSFSYKHGLLLFEYKIDLNRHSLMDIITKSQNGHKTLLCEIRHVSHFQSYELLCEFYSARKDAT
jgi:hypothetical protein